MRRSPVLFAASTVGLLLAACCCPQRGTRPWDPLMPQTQGPRSIPAGPRAMPAPPAVATTPVPAVVPSLPAPALVPPAPVAPKAVPYNATCPVMLGNPVNPDITTVWEGKVVGFCSETCRLKFLKNPEKYAKNLP